MTHEDVDFAKMECEIATLIAQLSSSPSYLREAKEPFDTPDNMIPVAYAFFEVLVRAGGGSGREYEWNQFLKETLAEVIGKNDRRWYQ